ncbi:hypothetical protein BOTU111921_01175 [Bordetella tumbae]|uniref:hypothetical protein n=1 Tax=Bordetella tumbae TaxID=1649139 RepID=UPI0039F092DC
MRTLAPQDLTLISGGFSSSSFIDHYEDDRHLLVLKDADFLTTEGPKFIDNHVENLYLRAALKVTLHSAAILLSVAAIMAKINGDSDTY